VEFEEVVRRGHEAPLETDCGDASDGAFWQKSFWDHFLRADEQVEAVVSYVLNNPVRAGLATHWREYPFAGSLAIDLSPTDGGGGQAPALPNSWTGS
jgi:hypothetical protein